MPAPARSPWPRTERRCAARRLRGRPAAPRPAPGCGPAPAPAPAPRPVPAARRPAPSPSRLHASSCSGSCLCRRRLRTPLRRIEMGVEGAPRPRQPAHDGADRHAGNFRGLLVGRTLDTYQGDDRPLLGGQAGQRRSNGLQRQLALRDRPAVRADQPLRSLDVHNLAANLAGAHPIQPDVLCDPIHPGVEPRSGLPLVDPRQGAHTRVLHEIVALLGIAGESVRKSPEARQHRHHPLADLIPHAPPPGDCSTTSGALRLFPIYDKCTLAYRIGQSTLPPAACAGDPLLCQRDRDAGLELHAADDERGLHAGDVGGGGEVVDDEGLEGGQVGGHALQDEVGLAGQHVALAHQGPGQHPVLERPQVGLGLAVQADIGEGDHLEVERLLVEQGEIAGDDAGLLQRARPAKARRRRDAHLAGQLDVGDAPVGLQFLQDAPIGSIEACTHGAMTRGWQQLGENLTHGGAVSNNISRTALAAATTPAAADGLAAVRGSSGWIVSDGKAGHDAQTRGVFDALGLEYQIKRVDPSGIWKALSPWGPVDPAERFGTAQGQFHAPWPDFAIAVGRLTTAYIRRIKRVSGRATYTIILEDPKVGADAADLFWVPEHDRLRGPNVITSLTAPHSFTTRRIVELRRSMPPEIAALPAPRITVPLGGPNGDYRYTSAAVAHLAAALRSLAALGAGLMVTPSRRTPTEVAASVRDATAGLRCWFWDGAGENPYPQFLAHADAFVVPADSVNMTGEACATGKPVYVFRPDGGSRKFARFHAALARHGATRPLPARFERLEAWSYAPLNSAETIAAEIARRWLRRRHMLGPADGR